MYLKTTTIVSYTLSSLWTRIFVLYLFTEPREMHSPLLKYLLQKTCCLKLSQCEKKDDTYLQTEVI